MKCIEINHNKFASKSQRSMNRDPARDLPKKIQAPAPRTEPKVFVFTYVFTKKETALEVTVPILCDYNL